MKHNQLPPLCCTREKLFILWFQQPQSVFFRSTMYVLKPLPLRMFTSLRIFSKPAPLFIVRLLLRESRLIHANAIFYVE